MPRIGIHCIAGKSLNLVFAVRGVPSVIWLWHYLAYYVSPLTLILLEELPKWSGKFSLGCLDESVKSQDILPIALWWEIIHSNFLLFSPFLCLEWLFAELSGFTDFVPHLLVIWQPRDWDMYLLLKWLVSNC